MLEALNRRVSALEDENRELRSAVKACLNKSDSQETKRMLI